MALWLPTRRQLIASTTAAFAASSLPKRVWAAPGSNSLRFIVLGDWGRRGGDFQKAVAAGMKWSANNDGGARFVVTTGDNFYNTGVSDKQSSHWRESFLDIYGPLVNRPWFPSLGNHDYAGNPSAQLGGYDGTGWHMPQSSYVIRGSQFGHPEVDLFLIDTVMWNGGNSGLQKLISVRPGPGSSAALRSWLTDQLALSRAAIKLVFGHHPIYSVGPHGGTAQLPELERILKNAGVTAYINGHDHCLYHISDPQLDYICSGGGSQELRKYTGGPVPGCVLPNDCANGAPPPAARPQWQFYAGSAGHAVFDVSPAGVEFALIGRDMKELHRRRLPMRPVPSA